jgi:hypothetical protein
MRTLGMLGEVIGMAADICIRKECLPRAVYAEYLDDLKVAMNEGIPMDPPFGWLPGNEEAYHFMRPVGMYGNKTENCWYHFDQDGKPIEEVPEAIGICMEELGIMHKDGRPYRASSQNQPE